MIETARLDGIPLFAGLGEDDRAAVAAAASELEAEQGQVVVTEGDFGYALYAIEAGTASVSVAGEPTAELGPGDVFGEIAVISSGRRTASIVATSPLRLIVLFKRDVWALERRAPQAAAALRALIAKRRATPAG